MKTVADELAAELLELWRHVLGTGHPGAYAIFEELDLSLTQDTAPVALSHDELSVKELAERLSLSLPGASRAVDALVSRGLIDRREIEYLLHLRLVARAQALARQDRGELQQVSAIDVHGIPSISSRSCACRRRLMDARTRRCRRDGPARSCHPRRHCGRSVCDKRARQTCRKRRYV